MESERTERMNEIPLTGSKSSVGYNINDLLDILQIRG
jgi:hypothetical protein